MPSQQFRVRSGFSAGQRDSGSTTHTQANARVRIVALPRLPPDSRGQVSGLSPRTTNPSGRGFVHPGSATQTGQGAGSPDAPAAPPEGVGSELMGVFVPSTTDAGNKPGEVIPLEVGPEEPAYIPREGSFLWGRIV